MSSMSERGLLIRRMVVKPPCEKCGGRIKRVVVVEKVGGETVPVATGSKGRLVTTYECEKCGWKGD